MGNLTRREVLKAGSTAAVTALLNPLLGKAEGEKEGNNVMKPEPVQAPFEEICFMNATALVEMLRTKKVSSVEVVKAHLSQIARVNQKVNAIVTLVEEEQLLAEARAADDALAKGNWLGPLHGLPIGVKDLHATRGIRTTYGSPLHRDFVPDFDCRVVQREEAAGAIVIGKTNVPEVGLGSQTFNPIFGATHNPYDTTKTCGGSTGGGAVALACGMIPLADGSDMGGSLRNPPNFCNVVGIRTSPGRVPNPSAP